MLLAQLHLHIFELRSFFKCKSYLSFTGEIIPFSLQSIEVGVKFVAVAGIPDTRGLFLEIVGDPVWGLSLVRVDDHVLKVSVVHPRTVCLVHCLIL